MVVFEELDHHLTNECVKRPAKPAVCRLGCDAQWGGTVGELIGAEEDRFMHETEECIYRQVVQTSLCTSLWTNNSVVN